MSPADQPHAIGRRSTDPPTLWLSLALGSVLIHLVVFIIISVVFTRTAKVQLDAEPITVEFVDANANPVQAQAAAPTRAIAARPAQLSSSTSSNTQVQPTAIAAQSPAFKPPVEPPIIPQPVKRRRSAVKPQTPQPTPFSSSMPQQPSPTSAPSAPSAPSPSQPTPFPQQPSLPNPVQPNPSPTQPLPGTNSPSGVTGAGSAPTPQPTDPQKPAESDQIIAQQPQGRSVSVSIATDPDQVRFDPQQRPARLITRQQRVSIDYPDAIAQIPGHSIRIKVTLLINDKGFVVGTVQPSLLSPERADIKQADLDDIANQIFNKNKSWEFQPAQSESGPKPPVSNLTIDAQIQFP